MLRQDSLASIKGNMGLASAGTVAGQPRVVQDAGTVWRRDLGLA